MSGPLVTLIIFSEMCVTWLLTQLIVTIAEYKLKMKKNP